jgi:zinc transporter ZupT
MDLTLGDPALTVLAWSALSAGAAVFGVLPVVAFSRGGQELPTAWIGWANALAAGMMLAAAYLLAEAGLAGPALPAALGAALGALAIFATHAARRATAAPPPARSHEAGPAAGRTSVAIGALHSASEGLAIGVAMAADLRFGIFLALAIAVHNVPEAAVLCAALAGRGRRLPAAAALAVAVDVSQVVLAVGAFALAAAAPAALPWIQGFAVGALVNLVLTELMPASYREAGHTSIALVASVAMGIVVLLEGLALP